MKNETAKREIESLDYYLQNHTDDYSEESHTAMMMAIKALEQEPCDVFDEYGNYKYPSDVKLTEPNTATSMPCEDAINREDALMALTGEWTEITDEIIHRFIKRIKALPPVNPQLKTGHWIISPNDCFATCSECGLSGDKGIFKHYRWCPICGTKMSEIPTGSEKERKEEK